ncbi:hypothetical protein LO762_02600 [Actinocorallia sp. API 0066]|uniref:hypothetical protein n=1 Tax=Actinocorallia sp. API 0066 TaxID=2896846 RepID=UPI001E2DBBFB|nr:hypothetical protein [Actinocorallia sp. API 0066]MCD0448092.1 hypothetical protein [Actinocorallia sp. API 0066]
MGSTETSPLTQESPAALALRIGVVAAERALSTLLHNVDFEQAAEEGYDLRGFISAEDWPVFSLVLDTLAAPAPGDPRPLEERRSQALIDLARLCRAARTSSLVA